MRDDVRDAFLGSERGDEPGTFRATYRFDPELPVFTGHFPGDPLLPAVFEIEMVRHATEVFSLFSYRIAEVKKAKISARINPGELIAVDGRATEAEGGVRVTATLSVDSQVRANITLVLKPA